MKNIVISLFLAFVVMAGAASAELTTSDVSMTLDEGATKTETITLTSTELVDVVSITMSDLQGQGFNGLIASSRWTITPETIDSLNGNANVNLELNLGNEVPGNYSGTLTIAYTPNGQAMASTTKSVNVEVLDDSAPNPGASVLLPSTVELGGENQEREEDITHIFTIRNTGTQTLTGIELSTTLPNDDFDVRFQNAPTTLTSTEEAEVTMIVYVPGDLDAGILSGNSLVFKSNELTTRNVPLSIEAENNLEFKDISVTVTHSDGDDDTTDGLEDDNSPEVDEDVRPGDEIEIEIEIENLGNVDMDDVEVTIENDGELDVDEDDKMDIKDGDEEVFTFSFTVDDDADDGTEILTITVVGEDDNGAEHRLEIDIEFNIEVEDEDISIRSMDVFPRIVQCENNVRIDVDIKNIGADDADDAAVRIEIPQLNIIQWEDNIEVRDGDTETASFNIPINQGTPTGRYFVEVEAYYDRGDDSTDDDTVEFSVERCGSSNGGTNTDDEEEEEEDIEFDTTPPQSNQNRPPSATGSITAVGEPSFFESTGYLVLLTGLVVLLIIVIVALLITNKR